VEGVGLGTSNTSESVGLWRFPGFPLQRREGGGVGGKPAPPPAPFHGGESGAEVMFTVGLPRWLPSLAVEAHSSRSETPTVAAFRSLRGAGARKGCGRERVLVSSHFCLISPLLPNIPGEMAPSSSAELLESESTNARARGVVGALVENPDDTAASACACKPASSELRRRKVSSSSNPPLTPPEGAQPSSEAAVVVLLRFEFKLEAERVGEEETLEGSVSGVITSVLRVEPRSSVENFSRDMRVLSTPLIHAMFNKGEHYKSSIPCQLRDEIVVITNSIGVQA